MNKSAVFIISKGNIFKKCSDAYVVPVNCFGVMGAGLALQFKKNYPNLYYYYKDVCKYRKLYIGQVLTWENKDSKHPKYIICFPTKIAYYNKSEYRFIENGLKDLKNEIIQKKLNSISIPAIGCGLGSLDFNVVYKMIHKELKELRNIVITIYPPKEKKKFIEYNNIT